MPVPVDHNRDAMDAANIVDVVRINVELSAKRPRANIPFANLADDFRRDFSNGCLFGRVPPFGDHILNIVAVRADAQMRRITAGRGIARVHNHKPMVAVSARDWSLFQGVGDAMRGI